MTKLPRSYIYVSDSKVNALVPQASRRARRRLRQSSREAESSLKFGGFGAQGLTRVSRKEEYEPDRFQRLKVAEQLVRRDGEVGKLSDNTRWIEDELLMEWGLIYAPPTDPAPGPLAVLFIGERNGQVLALNGSAQHVIGYKGQGQPIRGSSHTTFWAGTWSRFPFVASIFLPDLSTSRIPFIQ